MTTPTPAGKPLPLTAQATLAHYQREAEHAADLAELKRLRYASSDLTKAARRVYELAEGFNVSGVYFGETPENRVALFALDLAIDAVIAASKEN